jgi:hypothetical protein
MSGDEKLVLLPKRGFRFGVHERTLICPVFAQRVHLCGNDASMTAIGDLLPGGGW